MIHIIAYHLLKSNFGIDLMQPIRISTGPISTSWFGRNGDSIKLDLLGGNYGSLV
jgi:hypothetical protein